MDVLLHIGQHKTGTTSFQHFLKDKQQELLKLGFYVPQSLAGFDNPSHFVLNLCCLSEEHFSPMKDAMLRQGKFDLAALSLALNEDLAMHYKKATMLGCHTMIFTNEGLYLLQTAAEYDKLKRFFAFAEKISCFCTFREKVSYAHSYRKQLTKQGIAFSSDRTSYAYVAEDSWLYNYADKKQLLNSSFDESIYLDYCPENAVQNLLDAMSIDIKVDAHAVRLNVTH
jgi:hypothetical protein